MSDPTVTIHKVVSFTYVIQDTEGRELERCDVPLSYVHGGNSEILPKVEEAMEGKTIGDLVEVTLSPDEGFGPHDPNLTFTDDIQNVPPQFRHVGAEVEFQSDQGEVKTFVVSKIEADKLTVDGNHPYAGKDIVFHIQIVDIRDATEEEIRDGVVSAPTTPVLH